MNKGQSQLLLGLILVTIVGISLAISYYVVIKPNVPNNQTTTTRPTITTTTSTSSTATVPTSTTTTTRTSTSTTSQTTQTTTSLITTTTTTSLFPPKPFVITMYHSFCFDWPLTNFGSYTPLVGPFYPSTQMNGTWYFHSQRGWTPEMIAQHAEWAKQYGIDAFALTYNPTRPPCLQRIIDNFQQNNMKWFFFTESQALQDSPPGSLANFTDDLVKYKDYSSYAKIDSKPIIMTYGAASKTADQLNQFRNTLEQRVGKVYIIGDVLYATATVPTVYPYCQPNVLFAGNKNIWVRIKSNDGLHHNFGLFIVDDEMGVTLSKRSNSTLSTQYQWVYFGSFYYNGTYNIRFSDWSESNITVDVIKLVDDTGDVKQTEAENVSGGTVVSDSSASNGLAVTRNSTGIYTWWPIPSPSKSSIDQYAGVFDRVSNYFSMSFFQNWQSCLPKIYDYLDSKSVNYASIASPGANCTYASWCKGRVYTPSANTFSAMLNLAKSRSNWIIITSFNEFMEGTNIEPTSEQNYTFLENLKK